MKKHSLTAEARSVSGRKVKNLRKKGLVPGSVYGKKVKSVSVAINLDSFIKVYQEAGESGLVELKVANEVKPVLIHNVQKNPLTGSPIHVEFYQVDLKEKVHAKVPVEFTGESAAVREKQGVLLTILDEIEVGALPTELPEKIEVDISGLSAVGEEIKVSDLKISSAVTVLTEAGLTIVKIAALVTKEAEAEAAAEAAAAATAAAESAAAAPAGVAGSDAAAPAEEGKGSPEKAPEAKKE